MNLYLVLTALNLVVAMLLLKNIDARPAGAWNIAHEDFQNTSNLTPPGGLVGTGRLNDFTFKARFTAELPAGSYPIKVYSQELKAYVNSMNIGPVEISGGANLLIRARLSAGTPILKVTSR